MYMFTITFVLGLGVALDSRGRVAIAANGYLLIPYSLGSVLFGLAGVGNVTTLGWIGFSACVLAALLIIPITRNAERNSIRTQLGYES